MLLLVNVERHQEVLGKIVADLVKYGVPISLVAGTDKICTRCSFVEKFNSKREGDQPLIVGLPQVGLHVQTTMNEVKDEAREEGPADGDRKSESPCVMAAATTTATNEVDQAIK
ncbi:hypothetical protein OSTOST_06772, partial [Ostertagia ostertagi]